MYFGDFTHEFTQAMDNLLTGLETLRTHIIFKAESIPAPYIAVNNIVNMEFNSRLF